MTESQGGGVISIRTYSDMSQRPRFVGELDFAGLELVDILAEYHFETEIECGRSSCRRKHLFGLLIVTASGIETNIGNCCGKRFFPDRFDEVHKRFTIRRDRKSREDAFAQFQSQLSAQRMAANSLWAEEYGGKWAHECQQVTRDAAPQCLLSRRAAMVSSGDFSLKIVERVTDQEAGLGFRRDAQFKDMTVGVLRGGMAFWISPKPTFTDINGTIALAERVTFAELKPKEQRELTNKLATVPAKIEEARNLIAQARDCYASSNLEQLYRVAPTETERDRVRAFVRQVAAVPPSKTKQVS